MSQFIRILYRSGEAGKVDDVTLNELIHSNSVKQFYRPSEDRWVDASGDAVRRSETRYRGPERRTDYRNADKQEEKPRGLFARLFQRREKLAPPKELSAVEWFQQGFIMLHSTGDYQGAMRAFATAIQLDPTYQRAFLNRGIVSECLGNCQQAVEDYSRAIQLTPDDAKVYYARGMALKRLGRELEAIVDLEKAADLRYRPAVDVLKSLGTTL